MTTVGFVMGTQELLIIAGIVVLLFGAKKVPEMMRGVGEGMKEFKKASREVADEPKESESPAENNQ